MASCCECGDEPSVSCVTELVICTSIHHPNNLSLFIHLFIHSFTGAYSPEWTFGLPFRGFLITHIQTHGGTPLYE
jgi:hypothetical protein